MSFDDLFADEGHLGKGIHAYLTALEGTQDIYEGPIRRGARLADPMLTDEEVEEVLAEAKRRRAAYPKSLQHQP